MVIKILASAIRLLVTFVLGIRIEVNLSNVHFETGINMAFKMKLIIYIYIYILIGILACRRLKKQETTLCVVWFWRADSRSKKRLRAQCDFGAETQRA